MLRNTALLLVSSLAICSAAAARSAGSNIVVTYTSPKAYNVTLNGSAVTTGTVIPAGSYTLIVNIDPNTGPQSPQFTVTGPGVNVNSDLNSTGMGMDSASSFGPYDLQTSSTYTIEDKNVGASTIVTFQTSSTVSSGGSSGSGSSGGSSGGGTQSNGGTAPSTGKSTSRGTLIGAISIFGKPSLSFKGEPAKTLKAGVYTLRVEDMSKKFGLLLGHGHARLVTLSGKAAVAMSSRAITLTAGKWFVECSDGNPRISFTVTAG